MADVKISQLTELSSANLAMDVDVLAVVDNSASATKKISAENLLAPIVINKATSVITNLGTVTTADINGGTIDGITSLTGGTGDLNWDSNTLVVDSSASNVGIGTAAPEVKLVVNNAYSGTASTSSGIRFTSNGVGDGTNRYNWIENNISGDGTSDDGGAHYDGASLMGFFIDSGAVDGSTRVMTIQREGVGIGLESPAADVKLHIAGAASSTQVPMLKLVGNSTNTEGIEITTTGSGNGFSAFDISTGGNASAFRVTNAGKVGIGTVTPNETVGMVQIEGNSQNYNNSPMITFKDTAGNANSRNWSIGCISDSYGNFVIGKGASNSDFLDSAADHVLTMAYDGNVGIGTASPNYPLTILSADGSNAYTQYLCDGVGTAGGDGFVVGLADAGSAYVWNYENTNIIFGTNGSERVRIPSAGGIAITGDFHDSATADESNYQISFGGDSTSAPRWGFRVSTSSNDEDLHLDRNLSGTPAICMTWDKVNGNVGIGCTDPDGTFEVRDGQSQFRANGANSNPVLIQNTYTSSGDQVHVPMYRGASIVGAIRTTLSATSYVTSSDYRLKENETPMVGSIDKLKELKPYSFNFKVEPDSEVSGFFAHEVSSIVPEAVSGEKDAVDDNGDIESQQIDQSKLVPLLVSALQEAIDRIEVLENA